MKKVKLFLGVSLAIVGLAQAAEAGVTACEKGVCQTFDTPQEIQTLLLDIHPFFKNPNARLDFCEANPQTLSCDTSGISWETASANATALFSIPVARSVPHKTSLSVEYLLKVNEFMPDCNLSPTTLGVGKENVIQMFSAPTTCKVMDKSNTKIQADFYIDYINFDMGILGGYYTVQALGDWVGRRDSYGLIQFTDGAKPLPLVVHYSANMIVSPVGASVNTSVMGPDGTYMGPNGAYIGPDGTPIAQGMQPREMFESENGFTFEEIQQFIGDAAQGVGDWWQQLKYTVNLDKKPPKDMPPDPEHWWHPFVDKIKKIIYLEPLDS